MRLCPERICSRRIRRRREELEGGQGGLCNLKGVAEDGGSKQAVEREDSRGRVERDRLMNCTLHKRLISLETTILEASPAAPRPGFPRAAVLSLSCTSLSYLTSALPPRIALDVHHIPIHKCLKPQVAPAPALLYAETR